MNQLSTSCTSLRFRIKMITRLESKHADIKARRGHDFYYLWEDPYPFNAKKVSVEYIPENWPQVVVTLSDEKIDSIKQLRYLRETGWEIEE